MFFMCATWRQIIDKHFYTLTWSYKSISVTSYMRGLYKSNKFEGTISIIKSDGTISSDFTYFQEFLQVNNKLLTVNKY